MAPRSLLLSTLVLIPLLTGCTSLRAGDEAEGPRVEHRQAELGDLGSVSVCGDVWLTQAPAPRHLDLAHRRGIRTVISLMPPRSPADDLVARECERNGMQFVRVGIVAELPTDAEVDRAMEALSRHDRGPTLMYCTSGALTATVFAIWRAARTGAPIEQVLEEARRTGMKPGAPESVVRTQVDRLLGQATTTRARPNDA